MKTCFHCQKEVAENFPQGLAGGKFYCWDCFYINDFITEKKYLSMVPAFGEDVRASIRGEKVIVWNGRKAPWEKADRKERSSKRYAKWRELVFRRDGYTCQHCGEHETRLNAHHIKSFSRYIAERYDLDNGLTLCESCHLELHEESQR